MSKKYPRDMIGYGSNSSHYAINSSFLSVDFGNQLPGLDETGGIVGLGPSTDQ